MTRRTLGLLATGLFLPGLGVANAQTSENVLVVINRTSVPSIEIGSHYVETRAIPVDNIVRISAPVSETIQRSEYQSAIENPIGTWILQHGLQDRILYIVLTKGIPLRVAGTEGPDGTVASVDSELTLLYRKLLGQQVRVIGRVPNPYFQGEAVMTDAKPFTRFTSDIYLVTRLDGFTVQDVRGLIDRGAAPSRDGKIVLDQKDTVADRGGDLWLREAAGRLTAANEGARVLLEGSLALASTGDAVLGYASWGSNDPSNRLRRFGFRFSNGALAALFVSTDGRTFVEPSATWAPANPNQLPGETGSGQTLAGDLIRDGVTGVASHVNEPFLDATIRPQVLFPAYLSGFNLAESYYLSMPFLGWQTIVIGDPLCAPFRTTVLAAAQIDQGTDAETDLPALFVARRLALLSSGLNVDGVKAVLKAEGVRHRDPKADVTDLLIRATALEPKLTVAHLQLASTYDRSEQYDLAIDRYRKVLNQDPSNAVALNNLAYALAVRKDNPKEALTLAERAYRYSNEAPGVADTLGWIQHLLGDDKTALPLLERAATALPNNADVLLHAAVVHALLGDKAKATRELDAAITIDDRVRTRPEAERVRSLLSVTTTHN